MKEKQHTPQESRAFYEQRGLLGRIAAIRPIWQELTSLYPIDWVQTPQDIVAENARFDGLKANLPPLFLQKYNRFTSLSASRQPSEQAEYEMLVMDPDARVAGGLLRVIEYAKQQRSLIRERYIACRVGDTNEQDIQRHVGFSDMMVPAEAIVGIVPGTFSFSVLVRPEVYDEFFSHAADLQGVYYATTPLYSYIRGEASEAIYRHEDGHALADVPVFDRIDMIVPNPRNMILALVQEYQQVTREQRHAKLQEIQEWFNRFVVNNIKRGELFAEIFSKWPMLAQVPEQTFASLMRNRASLLEEMRPDLSGVRRSLIDPSLRVLDDDMLRRDIARNLQILEEVPDKAFEHLDDFAIVLLLLPLTKIHHVADLVRMWIVE